MIEHEVEVAMVVQTTGDCSASFNAQVGAYQARGIVIPVPLSRVLEEAALLKEDPLEVLNQMLLITLERRKPTVDRIIRHTREAFGGWQKEGRYIAKDPLNKWRHGIGLTIDDIHDAVVGGETLMSDDMPQHDDDNNGSGTVILEIVQEFKRAVARLLESGASCKIKCAPYWARRDFILAVRRVRRYVESQGLRIKHRAGDGVVVIGAPVKKRWSWMSSLAFIEPGLSIFVRIGPRGEAAQQKQLWRRRVSRTKSYGKQELPWPGGLVVTQTFDFGHPGFRIGGSGFSIKNARNSNWRQGGGKFCLNGLVFSTPAVDEDAIDTMREDDLADLLAPNMLVRPAIDKEEGRQGFM